MVPAGLQAWLADPGRDPVFRAWLQDHTEIYGTPGPATVAHLSRSKLFNVCIKEKLCTGREKGEGGPDSWDSLRIAPSAENWALAQPLGRSSLEGGSVTIFC